MLDVPLWSQDRPFRNDSNVDIVRSTTLTSGYGQATSVSAAVQKTIRNPRLALPLVRSALSQRVLGPLNANRRPGAVALFHIGRCGSTVLTELLDQHPKMYWDGETYGRVLDELKDAGQDRSTSGFDPATYVEQRLQRSGSRWFGYDVKFFHVTDFNVTVDDYVKQITSRGITHLVVLRRRNYSAKSRLDRDRTATRLVPQEGRPRCRKDTSELQRERPQPFARSVRTMGPRVCNP